MRRRAAVGPNPDPPHDGADVAGQVAAAGGGGEVLLRVQAVRVDHEVAVCQVAGAQRRPSGRLRGGEGRRKGRGAEPHISGVLDLFLPLKNSGRARRSMAWTLQDQRGVWHRRAGGAAAASAAPYLL